jgi:CheY-like chemotaxis protein
MATKILIVDDDVDAVRLVGLMLERRGYAIVAAQSGAQALAKAQTETPDLVILDVMMPDMDGYEVCRRLRANPATADTPIMMFTAKTQKNDKVAGFQAGADDYLTKPIHPEELVSRLEAVLLRASRREDAAAAQAGAKVFGFLGSKGGVGTTTLAVNVAVSLVTGAAEGKRTILADMRSGLCATAFPLGLRHPGSIASLLQKPADQLDQFTIEAKIEEHKSGLRVLSGQPEPPGAAAPLSPAHAEAITRELGMMCDYLLLDLGIGLGEVNRRLLPRCHHVVVCIEPVRTSLALAEMLLSEMHTVLNLPQYKVSLVLVTKAPSAASFTKETIEGLLKHDLSGVITPAPELAFQSSDQATPMVLLQAGTLAAQQFQAIANHLAKV